MDTLALGFQIHHRLGSDSKTESLSADFTIDGRSLLEIVAEIEGWHGDYMGCFSRGWEGLNEASKAQLLLLSDPETEEGRRLIYVCPECADIGCGAIACVVTRDAEDYLWADFAYENGYEKARLLPGGTTNPV